VPFDTPTILYLQNHRAASEGLRADFLCDYCFDEFALVLAPIFDFCNPERSCRCNLCLRQPPNLRGSASYTVFHFTFNVDQSTTTNTMLYKQYEPAVNSNIYFSYAEIDSAHISCIEM